MQTCLSLRPLALLLLALSTPGWVLAQPSNSSLSSDAVPQGIPAEVWSHALAAHKEATTAGKTTSLTLTVIDYSRPATEKRLWVVDIISREVLGTEFVAHGQGSGELIPTRFSNKDGTHQSSLGTFITGSTYDGVRGRSLRLHGLETGINDKAYARGLVIHGTPNVSEAHARKGSMGRTEGCPAVSSKSAARVIGLIANGSVVFAWYPDRSFLERSAFLDRGVADSRLSASVSLF